METHLLLGNFDVDGTPGTPSKARRKHQTWSYTMALWNEFRSLVAWNLYRSPLPSMRNHSLSLLPTAFSQCQNIVKRPETSLTVDGSVKHLLTLPELPKPLVDYQPVEPVSNLAGHCMLLFDIVGCHLLSVGTFQQASSTGSSMIDTQLST